MIEGRSRRIDYGRGIPHCIHLSAGAAPPVGRDRAAPSVGVARVMRAPDGRALWPGQTDAALSTSSSRPAPHCLTALPGVIPDRPRSPIAASSKVLLPTTPEPIRSIVLGAFQASIGPRPTDCTRIARGRAAPGRRSAPEARWPGHGNAPDPMDPGRAPRRSRKSSARPTEPPPRRPDRTRPDRTRPEPLSVPRPPGWSWRPGCCRRRPRHRARPRGSTRAGFA
jgi:hypothetical protein